jgi:sulfur-carrier protein
MTVCVKLFAAAKEIAGRDEICVEVAQGGTIADVRQAVIDAVPALNQVARQSAWAIGTDYAAENARVENMAEVALIPPVSGG